MGRHSADASSGRPGEDSGPPSSVTPAESGASATLRPPVPAVRRRHLIAAIGSTLVGLVLLIFGFVSLIATEDPPAQTSQGTYAPSPAATSAPGPAATTAAASSSVPPPTPTVIPVTVLNASPDLTPGLATRVADALAAGGWPIADVSNYEATPIEQTTVYFTAGNAAEEAAAQALVTQFPDIAGGAQPRFAALGGAGLTVAAVGDWLP